MTQTAANRRPAFNPARPAQFVPDPHRRAMIAKIQIARKDLAMEEDDYRQIVFDQTGRTSIKEASHAELGAVLAVMKAKGFRALPRSGSAPGADHKVARKARALWISLWHLGVVHNPAEAALEAMAKRQFGCDRLAWIRQGDGYKLIETLKVWAEKAGWPQASATGAKLTVEQLQMTLCEAILAKLQAAGAVPADWTVGIALERLCGMSLSDGWSTVETYSRAAAALGKALRELAPGLRQAQDEREVRK